MKKLASLLVVPVLICAMAGEGLAEESAPKPESKWYGWQTLLADGLSYGAVMAGTAHDILMPLGFMGVAGYLAAPAAIHGVHHHPGRATASVLLRLALPATGAMLGLSMADDCSSDQGLLSFCPLGEMVVGVMVGMGAAVAIDAIVAWDTRPPAQPATPPPTRSTRRPALSFTSAGIAPTSNGARLMVGGVF